MPRNLSVKSDLESKNDAWLFEYFKLYTFFDLRIWELLQEVMIYRIQPNGQVEYYSEDLDTWSDSELSVNDFVYAVCDVKMVPIIGAKKSNG